MLKKRQNVDNLSLQELEQALHLKRRRARQERFIRLSADGATRQSALLGDTDPNAPLLEAGTITTSGPNPLPAPSPSGSALPLAGITPSRKRPFRDRLLLAIEVAALIGLVVIMVTSYLNLRTLNEEVVAAQESSRFDQVIAERLFNQPEPNNPVAPSLATLPFDRLPGGHTPPTAPEGAVPEIPAHLQNWVQPPPPVPVPKRDAAEATRIVIPKINVDARIVQGVGWEDLKKGVGQLPGSAKPGERGNLYLAAHNDIYGEIFRYLEKLEPGDKYYIYAGEAKYTYTVREKRIIEPTEVGVMLPATEPVATLQTCYPYLIDTHRLVVIGDLVD